MNIRLAFACATLFASSMAMAREDQIILLGNVSGKQTVSADGNSAEYSYNDRGRGDHRCGKQQRDTIAVRNPADVLRREPVVFHEAAGGSVGSYRGTCVAKHWRFNAFVHRRS